MIPFDGLIFDLDGTLWDTTHAVATARNVVIRQLGLPGREVTPAEVGKLAGLPVDEIYRRCYGELGEAAIEKIRAAVGAEIARQIPSGGVTLYPGLNEGLVRLAGHFDLYIVSNCNPGYIDMFFALSGTEKLFRDHECWGKTLKPKGDNIRAVALRNGLSAALYVGDTTGDETAAREAGVAFLHAAWGFGEASPGARRSPSFQAMVEGLLSTSPSVSST